MAALCYGTDGCILQGTVVLTLLLYAARPRGTDCGVWGGVGARGPGSGADGCCGRCACLLYTSPSPRDRG
eukprot:535094-Rhodomonas_salina.1